MSRCMGAWQVQKMIGFPADQRKQFAQLNCNRCISIFKEGWGGYSIKEKPRKVLENQVLVTKSMSVLIILFAGIVEALPLSSLIGYHPFCFCYLNYFLYFQALREQILKMKGYLVSCRLAVQDRLLLLVSLQSLLQNVSPHECICGSVCYCRFMQVIVLLGQCDRNVDYVEECCIKTSWDHNSRVGYIRKISKQCVECLDFSEKLGTLQKISSPYDIISKYSPLPHQVKSEFITFILESV